MLELSAHDRVVITKIRSNPNGMSEAERIVLAHTSDHWYGGSKVTRRREPRVGALAPLAQ